MTPIFLCVGTTRHYEKIEDAIKKLCKRYTAKVSLPDKNARALILGDQTEDVKNQPHFKELYKEWVEDTEGYNWRDLKDKMISVLISDCRNKFYSLKGLKVRSCLDEFQELQNSGPWILF